MESELIALSSASEEASWLLNFLSDIPIWHKPIPVTLIHCDSIAAIGRVQNQYYSCKLQQIRHKHSTMREFVSESFVIINYVRSGDNLAGPLTKALAREKVCSASKGMGLKSI